MEGELNKTYVKPHPIEERRSENRPEELPRLGTWQSEHTRPTDRYDRPKSNRC